MADTGPLRNLFEVFCFLVVDQLLGLISKKEKLTKFWFFTRVTPTVAGSVVALKVNIKIVSASII